MARVEVTAHVEAPLERVWQVLTDWEGQARWMADARSVAVLSPQREGEGVVLRCRTDIALGIVVRDDMVVTGWEDRRSITVRHEGPLIRGIGAFELEPTPHGTRFTWWEEIVAPLGSVGDALAAVLVVPWVTRVFRSSLAGLKRIAEEPPPSAAAA